MAIEFDTEPIRALAREWMTTGDTLYRETFAMAYTVIGMTYTWQGPASTSARQLFFDAGGGPSVWQTMNQACVSAWEIGYALSDYADEIDRALAEARRAQVVMALIAIFAVIIEAALFGVGALLSRLLAFAARILARIETLVSQIRFLPTIVNFVRGGTIGATTSVASELTAQVIATRIMNVPLVIDGRDVALTAGLGFWIGGVFTLPDSPPTLTPRPVPSPTPSPSPAPAPMPSLSPSPSTLNSVTDSPMTLNPIRTSVGEVVTPPIAGRTVGDGPTIPATVGRPEVNRPTNALQFDPGDRVIAPRPDSPTPHTATRDSSVSGDLIPPPTRAASPDVPQPAGRTSTPDSPTPRPVVETPSSAASRPSLDGSSPGSSARPLLDTPSSSVSRPLLDTPSSSAPRPLPGTPSFDSPGSSTRPLLDSPPSRVNIELPSSPRPSLELPSTVPVRAPSEPLGPANLGSSPAAGNLTAPAPSGLATSSSSSPPAMTPRTIGDTTLVTPARFGAEPAPSPAGVRTPDPTITRPDAYRTATDRTDADRTEADRTVTDRSDADLAVADRTDSLVGDQFQLLEQAKVPTTAPRTATGGDLLDLPNAPTREPMSDATLQARADQQLADRLAAVPTADRPSWIARLRSDDPDVIHQAQLDLETITVGQRAAAAAAETAALRDRLTALGEVKPDPLPDPRFGYRPTRADAVDLSEAQAGGWDQARNSAQRSGDIRRIDQVEQNIRDQGWEPVPTRTEAEVIQQLDRAPSVPESTFDAAWGAAAARDARAVGMPDADITAHLNRIRGEADFGEPAGLVAAFADFDAAVGRHAGMPEPDIASHRARIDELVADLRIGDALDQVRTFREAVGGHRDVRALEIRADQLRRADAMEVGMTDTRYQQLRDDIDRAVADGDQQRVRQAHDRLVAEIDTLRARRDDLAATRLDQEIGHLEQRIARLRELTDEQRAALARNERADGGDPIDPAVRERLDAAVPPRHVFPDVPPSDLPSVPRDTPGGATGSGAAERLLAERLQALRASQPDPPPPASGRAGGPEPAESVPAGGPDRTLPSSATGDLPELPNVPDLVARRTDRPDPAATGGHPRQDTPGDDVAMATRQRDPIPDPIPDPDLPTHPPRDVDWIAVSDRYLDIVRAAERSHAAGLDTAARPADAIPNRTPVDDQPVEVVTATPSPVGLTPEPIRQALAPELDQRLELAVLRTEFDLRASLNPVAVATVTSWAYSAGLLVTQQVWQGHEPQPDDARWAQWQAELDQLGEQLEERLLTAWQQQELETSAAQAYHRVLRTVADGPDITSLISAVDLQQIGLRFRGDYLAEYGGDFTTATDSFTEALRDLLEPPHTRLSDEERAAAWERTTAELRDQFDRRVQAAEAVEQQRPDLRESIVGELQRAARDAATRAQLTGSAELAPVTSAEQPPVTVGDPLPATPDAAVLDDYLAQANQAYDQVWAPVVAAGARHFDDAFQQAGRQWEATRTALLQGIREEQLSRAEFARYERQLGATVVAAAARGLTADEIELGVTALRTDVSAALRTQLAAPQPFLQRRSGQWQAAEQQLRDHIDDHFQQLTTVVRAHPDLTRSAVLDAWREAYRSTADDTGAQRAERATELLRRGQSQPQTRQQSAAATRDRTVTDADQNTAVPDAFAVPAQARLRAATADITAQITRLATDASADPAVRVQAGAAEMFAPVLAELLRGEVAAAQARAQRGDFADTAIRAALADLDAAVDAITGNVPRLLLHADALAAELRAARTDFAGLVADRSVAPSVAARLRAEYGQARLTGYEQLYGGQRVGLPRPVGVRALDELALHADDTGSLVRQAATAVAPSLLRALDSLRPWSQGLAECAPRILDVVGRLGTVPAQAVDDGAGDRTVDRIGRLLDGRFQDSWATTLDELRPGAVTVVWLDPANDHAHLVLVYRQVDDRLVIVETLVDGTPAYQLTPLSDPAGLGRIRLPLDAGGGLAQLVLDSSAASVTVGPVGQPAGLSGTGTVSGAGGLSADRHVRVDALVDPGGASPGMLRGFPWRPVVAPTIEMTPISSVRRWQDLAVLDEVDRAMHGDSVLAAAQRRAQLFAAVSDGRASPEQYIEVAGEIARYDMLIEHRESRLRDSLPEIARWILRQPGLTGAQHRVLRTAAEVALTIERPPGREEIGQAVQRARDDAAVEVAGGVPAQLPDRIRDAVAVGDVIAASLAVLWDRRAELLDRVAAVRRGPLRVQQQLVLPAAAGTAGSLADLVETVLRAAELQGVPIDQATVAALRARVDEPPPTTDESSEAADDTPPPADEDLVADLAGLSLRVIELSGAQAASLVGETRHGPASGTALTIARQAGIWRAVVRDVVPARTAQPDVPWHVDHGALGQSAVRAAWWPDPARTASSMLRQRLAPADVVPQQVRRVAQLAEFRAGLQQQLATILAAGRSVSAATAEAATGAEPAAGEQERLRYWDDLLQTGLTVEIAGSLVWIRMRPRELVPRAAVVSATSRFAVSFSATSVNGTTDHGSDRSLADAGLEVLTGLASAAISRLMAAVPKLSYRSSRGWSSSDTTKLISGRKLFGGGMSDFDGLLTAEISIDGHLVDSLLVPPGDGEFAIAFPTAYVDSPRRPAETPPDQAPGQGQQPDLSQAARQVVNAVDVSAAVRALHRSLRAVPGLPVSDAVAIATQITRDPLNERAVRNRSINLIGNGVTLDLVHRRTGLLSSFKVVPRVRLVPRRLQHLSESAALPTVRGREDRGLIGGAAESRSESTAHAVGVGLAARGIKLTKDPVAGNLAGSGKIEYERGASSSLDLTGGNHTVINTNGQQERYAVTFSVEVDFLGTTTRIDPVVAEDIPAELGVPVQDNAAFQQRLLGHGAVAVPQQWIDLQPDPAVQLSGNLTAADLDQLLGQPFPHARQLRGPHERDAIAEVPFLLAAGRGHGDAMLVTWAGVERVRPAVESILAEAERSQFRAARAEKFVDDWARVQQLLDTVFSQGALEGDPDRVWAGAYQQFEISGAIFDVVVTAHPRQIDTDTVAADSMTVNTRALRGRTVEGGRSSGWTVSGSVAGQAIIGSGDTRLVIGPEVSGSYGWTSDQSQTSGLSEYIRSEFRTQQTVQIETIITIAVQERSPQQPGFTAVRRLTGDRIIETVAIPPYYAAAQHSGQSLSYTSIVSRLNQASYAVLAPQLNGLAEHGVGGIRAFFGNVPELTALAARLWAAANYVRSDPMTWSAQLRKIGDGGELSGALSDLVSRRGWVVPLGRKDGVESVAVIRMVIYQPSETDTSEDGEVEKYSQSVFQMGASQETTRSVGASAGGGLQVDLIPSNDSEDGASARLLGTATGTGEMSAGTSASQQQGWINITRETTRGPHFTASVAFQIEVRSWDARQTDPPVRVQGPRYVAVREAVALLVDTRLATLLGLPRAPQAAPPTLTSMVMNADLARAFSHVEHIAAPDVLSAVEVRMRHLGLASDAVAREDLLHRQIAETFADDRLALNQFELFGTGMVRGFPVLGGIRTGLLIVTVRGRTTGTVSSAPRLSTDGTFRSEGMRETAAGSSRGIARGYTLTGRALGSDADGDAGGVTGTRDKDYEVTYGQGDTTTVKSIARLDTKSGDMTEFRENAQFAVEVDFVDLPRDLLALAVSSFTPLWNMLTDFVRQGAVGPIVRVTGRPATGTLRKIVPTVLTQPYASVRRARWKQLITAGQPWAPATTNRPRWLTTERIDELAARESFNAGLLSDDSVQLMTLPAAAVVAELSGMVLASRGAGPAAVAPAAVGTVPLLQRLMASESNLRQHLPELLGPAGFPVGVDPQLTVRIYVTAVHQLVDATDAPVGIRSKGRAYTQSTTAPKVSLATGESSASSLTVDGGNGMPKPDPTPSIWLNRLGGTGAPGIGEQQSTERGSALDTTDERNAEVTETFWIRGLDLTVVVTRPDGSGLARHVPAGATIASTRADSAVSSMTGTVQSPAPSTMVANRPGWTAQLAALTGILGSLTQQRTGAPPAVPPGRPETATITTVTPPATAALAETALAETATATPTPVLATPVLATPALAAATLIPEGSIAAALATTSNAATAAIASDAVTRPVPARTVELRYQVDAGSGTLAQCLIRSAIAAAPSAVAEVVPAERRADLAAIERDMAELRRQTAGQGLRQRPWNFPAHRMPQLEVVAGALQQAIVARIGLNDPADDGFFATIGQRGRTDGYEEPVAEVRTRLTRAVRTWDLRSDVGEEFIQLVGLVLDRRIMVATTSLLHGTTVTTAADPVNFGSIRAATESPVLLFFQPPGDRSAEHGIGHYRAWLPPADIGLAQAVPPPAGTTFAPVPTRTRAVAVGDGADLADIITNLDLPAGMLGAVTHAVAGRPSVAGMAVDDLDQWVEQTITQLEHHAGQDGVDGVVLAGCELGAMPLDPETASNRDTPADGAQNQATTPQLVSRPAVAQRLADRLGARDGVISPMVVASTAPVWVSSVSGRLFSGDTVQDTDGTLRPGEPVPLMVFRPGSQPEPYPGAATGWLTDADAADSGAWIRLMLRTAPRPLPATPAASLPAPAASAPALPDILDPLLYAAATVPVPRWARDTPRTPLDPRAVLARLNRSIDDLLASRPGAAGRLLGELSRVTADEDLRQRIDHDTGGLAHLEYRLPAGTELRALVRVLTGPMPALRPRHGGHAAIVERIHDLVGQPDRAAAELVQILTVLRRDPVGLAQVAAGYHERYGVLAFSEHLSGLVAQLPEPWAGYLRHLFDDGNLDLPAVSPAEAVRAYAMLIDEVRGVADGTGVSPAGATSPEDGCVTDALRSGTRLARWGIASRQVFLHGDDLSITSVAAAGATWQSPVEVLWYLHVAPLIIVEHLGRRYEVVLDLAVGLRGVADWVSRIAAPTQWPTRLTEAQASVFTSAYEEVGPDAQIMLAGPSATRNVLYTMPRGFALPMNRVLPHVEVLESIDDGKPVPIGVTRRDDELGRLLFRDIEASLRLNGVTALRDPALIDLIDRHPGRAIVLGPRPEAAVTRRDQQTDDDVSRHLAALLPRLGPAGLSQLAAILQRAIDRPDPRPPLLTSRDAAAAPVVVRPVDPPQSATSPVTTNELSGWLLWPAYRPDLLMVAQPGGADPHIGGVLPQLRLPGGASAVVVPARDGQPVVSGRPVPAQIFADVVGAALRNRYPTGTRDIYLVASGLATPPSSAQVPTSVAQLLAAAAGAQFRIWAVRGDLALSQSGAMWTGILGPDSFGFLRPRTTGRFEHVPPPGVAPAASRAPFPPAVSPADSGPWMPAAPRQRTRQPWQGVPAWTPGQGDTDRR